MAGFIIMALDLRLRGNERSAGQLEKIMVETTISRRNLLRLLAGGAALPAAGPSEAGEARIERLIAEAQRFSTISTRIDFISAALRGTRYQGYTLIGGLKRPERFVLRDDAFDCVTFCETVLAAARARDIPEFETTLQDIRYRHGFVSRRPDLDYFHAGLVAFAPDCTLLLRHASESRSRVLDERMDRFLAHNRVRYVTPLRPEERVAAVAVKKAI